MNLSSLVKLLHLSTHLHDSGPHLVSVDDYTIVYYLKMHFYQGFYIIILHLKYL
jgi:hypothetical protein